MSAAIASKSAPPMSVRIGPSALRGDLCVPDGAQALIVFAHGSGSSRLSPRNRAVAAALNDQDMATLLFDLLSMEEEADRLKVFDIGLLARRLVEAVEWIGRKSGLVQLPLGFFGASTGAAAALVAAAEVGRRVGAIVSRGGRPDLAKPVLPLVRAPTLLIVGGADLEVLALNRQAFARLTAPKALKVVAGATHLFEEPGAMDEVIAHAGSWFRTHLMAPGGGA